MEFCMCFSSRLFGIPGVHHEQPVQLGRGEASARTEKITSRAAGCPGKSALVDQSAFNKREYYIRPYSRSLELCMCAFFRHAKARTLFIATIVYLMRRLAQSDIVIMATN